MLAGAAFWLGTVLRSTARMCCCSGMKSRSSSTSSTSTLRFRDEEFEAFLLELLSDFQVSIPELGTIRSRNRPVIILTSNNTRQLSDALRRRCVYLFIDYPTMEKEIAIINSKVNGVPEKLAADIAAAVAYLRKNEKIFKKPSIAETLDWVSALMALDRKRLDEESAMKTLGFVLKNQEDIMEFSEDGGFGRFIAEQLT